MMYSVTYFMLPLPVHSATTGDKSDKGDKGDKPSKRPPGGGADADPNPKTQEEGRRQRQERSSTCCPQGHAFSYTAE